MTGQEVSSKEELACPALESPQVNPLPLEVNVARIKAAYLADRDEEVTPFNFDDEANDRRMGGVSHCDDQVLHPTEPVTCPIDQWPLNDVRKMNHLKPHVRHHFFVVHDETVCLDGWSSP
jgi:hypothetical protein